MIRTARVKLDVTHDQATALRDTLTAMNAASAHVAAVAWDLRNGDRPPGRHQLHHATYYTTRARFGLAAQATSLLRRAFSLSATHHHPPQAGGSGLNRQGGQFQSVARGSLSGLDP